MTLARAGRRGAALQGCERRAEALRHSCETACSHQAERRVRVRSRAFVGAVIAALIAIGASTRTTSALGRPGVTPVPCPDQAWQIGDPKFEALEARSFLESFGPVSVVEVEY